MWVMDGSASLGETLFKRTLGFASGVTNEMNVSPTYDQVSMIQFSNVGFGGDKQVRKPYT